MDIYCIDRQYSWLFLVMLPVMVASTAGFLTIVVVYSLSVLRTKFFKL